MKNKIQIVGGKRDGQFMDWIGNRVSINGVDHVLYSATYPDGSKREYYAKEGVTLPLNLWMSGATDIETLG